MTGFVAVSMRGEGEYRAPLDEYTRILDQFKTSSSVIEFTGIYGQPVCVRAEAAEAVTRWSPEALESFEASKPQETQFS